MILRDKSIILGVTGGIAAYKAVEIASRLVKGGAQVDVVMTPAATHFVGALTFQAITGRPVAIEMFALLRETDIAHVSLAKRADLLIIAPLTANTLAKLAHGLADNLLTAVALDTRAPLLLAPAMESGMWENPLTQENLTRLRQVRDVVVVGPATGRLASGAMGVGRMAEPAEIVDAARWVLGRMGLLKEKKVVVTSGGTREPLDPVRVFTNRSSGRMGVALAAAARDAGAEVTLIHTSGGPPVPWGVRAVEVETAQEMRDAVLEAVAEADALIMAAAVADYRPAQTSEQKIKKTSGPLVVQMERTPDILAEVAARRAELPRLRAVIGFAAETEHVVENARDKLRRKRLELIVANDARAAMGAETNQVTLIAADGSVEELPLLPKEQVAERIIARLATLL
ncbi:MAG: bifunctional phosphopantothenoylcysteine decarboxylase/phosphopantothenate--cysteine ligase CoaBC [Anaerolineae bacterium]|nr:bifunctional phosphopantothenoylcysteine decarboxylase/phosphopantothenate--cysteine ligase CoaBC [Anaerolineae bacterium]